MLHEEILVFIGKSQLVDVLRFKTNVAAELVKKIDENFAVGNIKTSHLEDILKESAHQYQDQLTEQ